MRAGIHGTLNFAQSFSQNRSGEGRKPKDESPSGLRDLKIHGDE